jgi:gamma-glutamylcyclotransferase (GGCT)/AIG2-like uncharacterized protein YtfP
VLYFAYGSNMASEQVGAGARFLRAARLEGYRLALLRRSIRWQAGVLDIVPAPGGEVWGALYDLTDEQLERIDAKEAAGVSYRRIEVELDGGPALAYEVIEKEPEDVPCAPEYRAVVLAGALERGLPDHWVQELASGLLSPDVGNRTP